MKKMTVKNAIISTLVCLVVVAFPCLFIYFNNAGEANLADILPIWAMLSGAILAVFVVLMTVYRDAAKTALVTAVFAAVFMNFAIIESVLCRIFPCLYYWHVAYILLIIIVGFAVIVKTHVKCETAMLVNRVLLLVGIVLIILNGVLAIPTIKTKLTESSALSTDISGKAGRVNGADKMPNVYLCIFDEYGGYECLREYCKYDNALFYDQLRDRGFNISLDSYGKSISTHTEVPNLLNISYVNSSDMLISEQERNLINPVVYQVFRQAGYKLNVAGQGFLDAVGCDYVYNEDFGSKEFSAEYYIVMNTAYYPFYKHNDTDEADALQNHLTYITKSSQLESDSLFTISYVCCPHLPWFVNENGQRIDASLRENWLERDTYLGQLKYLNKLIIPMVDMILENDPESIIILCSDHGFRCVTEGETMYGVDSGEDKKYEMNILNAVYYQGKALDIEGKSNINTMRTVLNKLFQSDYEMLE